MLTKDEIDFLDAYGYLGLGQLLTPEQVKQINDRIAELLQTEGDNAGAELAESKYIRHPKEEGADRLADLVNKGEIFDIFYTHPRVLGGIEAVLGQQYKLSSLNYRAAKPGMGLQKLHVDWKNTVVSGAYKVCNSIWLLDDFTALNGSTRIVPKTHRSTLLPDEVMADANENIPTKSGLLHPQVLYLFSTRMYGMVAPPMKQQVTAGASTVIFAAGNNHNKLIRKNILPKRLHSALAQKGSIFWMCNRSLM